MNELLLKKRVSIYDIHILQFIYPDLSIISGIGEPIDYHKGVIYTGMVDEGIIKRLDSLTCAKYIVLSEYPDISLNRPSEFMSLFYPKVRNKARLYDQYSMDDFIPLFKGYFILNKVPPLPNKEDTCLYRLFKAMLSYGDAFYKEYFLCLEQMPASAIYSSLLTFLVKVQSQNYTNCGPAYKKLINSAYLKFGDRISHTISSMISSSQRTDIAIVMLVDMLYQTESVKTHGL